MMMTYCMFEVSKIAQSTKFTAPKAEFLLFILLEM